MLTRLLRPLCALRIHGRGVQVVDDYDLIGMSPLGIEGRVLRSHIECRRCHRHR